MSDKPNDKSAISQRAVAKLAAGASIQAIVPTTIEETFRLAELVHQSGLAPWQLKSAAAVTVVFLKGLEIGLPPMAAMETIGVINGKACLHSDGIPALLWSRGFKIKEWYENEGDLDNHVAHCKITRPEGDEYEFKYSAQDARDNGLWQTEPKVRDKHGAMVDNKSPWYLFQKRMTRMRCRGWLARDCASDVLKGIPIFEEQADIDLGRGEYREVKQPALAVPDDIPGEEETVAATGVSEAESDQDAQVANPEQYLRRLEEQLETVETEELFSEVWESHLELVEAGRLSKYMRDTAENLHEKYARRFQKE